MSKLSKEKMKQIIESKNLCYKDVAFDLGISVSNVSKVFGGFRTNMQLSSLIMFADYFGCTVDDFIEYDCNNDNYYQETIERKIATSLSQNKKLLNLMTACETLTDEQIDVLNKMVRTFK